MADVQKEIALKVTTDVGQTTNALQTAEFRLNEAKKAMVDLALAGKQGTQEFRDLAIEAGTLKGKLELVEQTVDGIGKSTNKIEVFSGAMQGLSAGFAIAQGTAALFAEGNEEVQEALLKVQASLALLQGTEQAVQLLRKESAAGQALLTARTAAYNVVVGASTGALKLFRIALVSTGIGAIVVAVGLLVANWEKLTAAINPASKALNDYNKESEKAEELSKKRAAATDLEIRRLKALGVEELELMRIKRAAVEQDIKDTDRQLAAQQKALELSIEQFYKQQADVAEGRFGAIGEIITNFFGVNNEDLKKLSDQLDEVKAIRRELGVEVLEIDASITKEIDNENGKRIQQQITALENQKAIAAAAGQDIFQLDVEIAKKRIQLAKETNGDIAKAEADLQVVLITERIKALALQEELSKINKETEDKKVEARKAAQKQLDDINNEIRRSQLTEYQREQEDFLAQRAKMLELMRASGASEIELQLFASNTAAMIRNAANEKEVEDAKAKEDKKLSNQTAAILASIEVAKMGLQGIADLVAFFAGESEAQQKKAFEIQKRINIATTIIDGVLSAQKAYASLIGTPIVGPVLAPIAAGAAIAASLARVRAIQSTTFGATSAPSNTGGNVTMTSSAGVGQQPPAAFSPNVTPTNPTGQPNPQGQGQQPLRAYVVDRDIENASSRRNMLRDFAAI
jgi:hypothetical protein